MDFSFVFIDANVLIEILLRRRRRAAAEAALRRAGSNGAISALTGHLVTHFGLEMYELPILRQFLADYALLPLEAIDFTWAFTNIRGKDFEDALQLAVAIRHGCSEFVTFDRDLFKAYANLPSIAIQLL